MCRRLSPSAEPSPSARRRCDGSRLVLNSPRFLRARVGRHNVLHVPNIDRKATGEQIRDAYRKLALRWHPDLNPDPRAEETFKSLYKAYRCLADPDTRARYDEILDRPADQRGDASIGVEMPPEPVGKRPRTGADRYAELLVPRRIRKQKHRLGFSRWDACRRCDGTGEGRQGRACPMCMGIGQVLAPREVVLNVQARSLKDGTLTLAHEGDVGINGGPRGDLVVRIVTPQNTYVGLIVPAIIAALVFFALFGFLFLILINT